MKIKEILKLGVEKLNNDNIEDASLKAKIILSDILNKDKEYVIIYQDNDIEERLRKHEPLQYLINRQEFMGFNFYVDNNVLIPQPDTENLVEEVIYISDNIKKNRNNKLKILDLCTGSGAIAISLEKLIDKVLLYASDISKTALKIAYENAVTNMANVLFLESDLFKNIPLLYKFDIIVSNPPYIETDTISSLPEEVKQEPIIALDGGKDGLDFYRKIIKNAKNYLEKDGYLVLEIGYNQRKNVEDLLKKYNYKNIYCKKDLSGNDRVMVSQKGE